MKDAIEDDAPTRIDREPEIVTAVAGPPRGLRGQIRSRAIVGLRGRGILDPSPGHDPLQADPRRRDDALVAASRGHPRDPDLDVARVALSHGAARAERAAVIDRATIAIAIQGASACLP